MVCQPLLLILYHQQIAEGMLCPFIQVAEE